MKPPNSPLEPTGHHANVPVIDEKLTKPPAMEQKPFPIQLDGETKQLTPDNCGIAMFRDTPDNDYLDVWEPGTEEGSEKHIWVFNNREFLLWMGGVALNGEDFRTIALANRSNGSFADNYGWRPQVVIETKPREWEQELYVRYNTRDLEDEWSHLFDEEEDDGA